MQQPVQRSVEAVVGESLVCAAEATVGDRRRGDEDTSGTGKPAMEERKSSKRPRLLLLDAEMGTPAG